jgi:hypothetical protein
MSDETQGTPAPEAPVQERQKPGPKPKAVATVKVDAADVVEAMKSYFLSLQTPDIGRSVNYITGNGTIRPAVISKVHGDGETVDLTVFNSEGAVPVVGVQHESIEQEWIESVEDIAGTYHWPL